MTRNANRAEGELSEAKHGRQIAVGEDPCVLPFKRVLPFKPVLPFRFGAVPIVLAGCLGLAAVPAADTCGGNETPIGSAKLPNFIIFLTDDLGYGDLGCYGNLRNDEITIAELLKQKGYQTGFFGKWHLSNLADSTQPDPGQKFDLMSSFPNASKKMSKIMIDQWLDIRQDFINIKNYD